MVRQAGLVIGLFAAVADVTGAPGQKPAPQLAAALSDPSRPPADRARDADRKPAETLAFAGIKPGDKVADLIPGSGYFTRIFAQTVGPQGHVYAAVPQAMAARPGALDGLNAIAAASPNVTAAPVDFARLEFPEKLDLVWTSENYHDFHNIPNMDVPALDKAIFAALKPGGVFIVEDHAAPGAGATVTATLHRIDPATVIAEAQAAGFRLEAQSSLLANPADPHTAGVRDPSIRGKTDKFLLKFRKPA